MSAESSTRYNNEDRNLCFGRWMDLQKSDLEELMQALSIPTSSSDKEAESLADERFNKLSEKCIQHFEEYIMNRSILAHRDVIPYFTPSWCSTLENSLLWISGCRPSIFIRLTYMLCGIALEDHLSEVLDGVNTRTMCDLTCQQLSKINALQAKTVCSEDLLATQLATIQEDVNDYPTASIAIKSLNPVADISSEIATALEKHEKDMVKVFEEADQLRLKTLKELLVILSPKQGVDLLVAGKKLHLSLHEWGKIKDREHGQNHLQFRKP